MISAKDIEKLASLARIKIEENEKEQFGKEIDSILGYVNQIKEAKVSLDQSERVGDIKNVLREDANPHETGVNTEKLLNEAPGREGQFVKVKKILQ
jgi:aspartyl-tRNA(Asn)/glutamyl-tRNA(Gln) amidotransferase subunit C